MASFHFLVRMCDKYGPFPVQPENVNEHWKNKINAVALDLGVHQADHKKLAERVAETESILAQLRSTILQSYTRIQCLQNDFLTEKLDDPKGRSRSNNVCLVEVAEKTEGLSVELSVEEWLLSAVHGGKASKFLMEKLDEAEVRPKSSNNVCLVVIGEKAEGLSVVLSVEDWLLSTALGGKDSGKTAQFSRWE
ncbi:hypothetical protein NDU88_009874 [Pleurodeles waltl]|uniref:Uncharacterized protein n=1 Tax=Pleurodeles waltl TaxID=8319 RepID=A0AAV7S0Y9_PLEWA|nr:hypothetical protein NDU88_009874 [Pleurodeles waltl]